MSNPDGRPPKHLPGSRFGRLVLLERGKGSNARWLCRCDCGDKISVYRNNVTSGKTQSCGCLHAERTNAACMTHGETVDGNKTAEFECWSGMKKRCYNPKASGYSRYGGRGIEVCDRWRESFESFLSDMGRKPSPSHSIDRIDNDGNYEPGNCRWATKSEQAQNRGTPTRAPDIGNAIR